MNKGRQKHETTKITDLKAFQELTQELQQHGFVKNGVTNPVLLDRSQLVARALYRGTKFRQRSDTVNQFRNFFNEVRGLKNLKGDTVRLGVALRMLKARIGYAAGRETISQDLSEVIDTCINTIIEREDIDVHLDGFCDFFEALYAYYYYHTKIK